MHHAGHGSSKCTVLVRQYGLVSSAPAWSEKLSRPDLPEQLRSWPRNLSTGAYGGLSTGAYGGMSTGAYGGASTGAYGGLSTGAFGGMSTGAYGGLSTGAYGGLSTGAYGGLSTGAYGGLSTGAYGGLSSGIGGGMSSAAGDSYRSNIPPWPYFLREVEARGLHQAAALIRRHLPQFLWPEHFFRRG